MEELKLAVPPQATAKKTHAPAYRENDVLALAALGEAGNLAQNTAYALRARGRQEALRTDLSRHRRRLTDALKLRDDELDTLGSKLDERGTADENEEQDPRKRTLIALQSGDVGVVLAMPVLDAFSKAREASLDVALHAAALNVVDDGAYRRGSELVALAAAFVAVAFGLLLLL